jgi:hypothetical protein
MGAPRKSAFNEPRTPVVRTKTNEKGLARFSWRSGVSILRVEVKGVGFGTTGIIEIPRNGTIRRVEVSADKTPASLPLDIGEPGTSAICTFVDDRGRPARGAVVSVRRPEGPLTERYWPAVFTADGAGILCLPPLEAGQHQIQVKPARVNRFQDKGKEHKISVPQLADKHAREPEFRMFIR